MKKQTRNMIAILLGLFLIISNSLNTDKVYGREDIRPDIIADIPNHMIKVGSTVTIKTKATLKGKKLSNIYYISEDKKVAKVDQNGKITALKAGWNRIFVKAKGYPDDECIIFLWVVDRIIKINGPDKYKLGKTYQLTASEKNVRWEVYNYDWDDARASIDSDTGKLKIRNGGRSYVFCTSKDGKGKGAAYIYTKGIKIKNEIIEFDPIKIKEDMHIASKDILAKMVKLPKKVKLHYNKGKKNGVVEAKVIWDLYQYSADDIKLIGENTLRGTIEPPEEYTMSQDETHVKLIFEFETEQTDIRKKITSIEDLEPLTISKDLHIWNYYDIEDYLKTVKLKCTLDDGSVVSLPISGFSYSGNDNCNKVGTYQCCLYPNLTDDYINEDHLGANLKFKIKTKQSYHYIPPKLTIKDIGGYSIITDYESQAPLSK